MSAEAPMTLDQLRAHLEPLSERPFVCDGSPLDCRMFIVGFNPATDDVPIWPHWGANGMDKAAWSRAYIARRRALKKRESPTRRAINKFVQSTRPLRILETNVFDKPSQSVAQLFDRNPAAFTFLLEHIAPEIVLLHGDDAKEAFANLANARGWTVDLPKSVATTKSFSDGIVLGRPLKLAAIYHFSHKRNEQVERILSQLKAITRA
jgi:hypothetical protein